MSKSSGVYSRPMSFQSTIYVIEILHILPKNYLNNFQRKFGTTYCKIFKHISNNSTFSDEHSNIIQVDKCTSSLQIKRLLTSLLGITRNTNGRQF